MMKYIMGKDLLSIIGSLIKKNQGRIRKCSRKFERSKNGANSINYYMKQYVNVGVFCAEAVSKATKMPAIKQ